MQLTQIQAEVIDTAYPQGQVDPDDVARLLLHDIDDVHAAIRDLVDRGLLENDESNVYRLTDRGQDVHRACEEAHRAEVIRRTRTWQPR